MATHLWLSHKVIHHNKIFCLTKQHQALEENHSQTQNTTSTPTSAPRTTQPGKIVQPRAAVAAGRPRAALGRPIFQIGPTFFPLLRISPRRPRPIRRQILPEVLSETVSR